MYRDILLVHHHVHIELAIFSQHWHTAISVTSPDIAPWKMTPQISASWQQQGELQWECTREHTGISKLPKSVGELMWLRNWKNNLMWLKGFCAPGLVMKIFKTSTSRLWHALQVSKAFNTIIVDENSRGNWGCRFEYLGYNIIPSPQY